MPKSWDHVPCPFCLVEPGENCTTAAGNERTKPHQARLVARFSRQRKSNVPSKRYITIELNDVTDDQYHDLYNLCFIGMTVGDLDAIVYTDQQTDVDGVSARLNEIAAGVWAVAKSASPARSTRGKRRTSA